MPATRQLAAIMFTDMVGFTALMQQNEQLAIQKRDRSKKIFEDALLKYDGKLLQYYGDGTMSLFTSGLNGVRAAIEMQTQFLREPRIDIRIGIHTGDVMTDENGIYGDSVNVASRIESLATPGGVFISEKLFDEVKNTEGISTKALGYFELKNVNQPIQVYAVTNPGLIVPAREDLIGKTKTALNGIAVLPFASMSTDPENEIFCDGMTEELINVLAKVEGLQVTARTSAYAFKGRSEDVREIAAKLNVQKIIEGSVRKAGNKIRVTVQLINASDGYHFWSETYDRNLEDIFEVQDDISRAIANKLRSNLSTEQHQSRLAIAPTENLNAYKKYLEGLHYWNLQTLENIMKAAQCFHETTAMQPDFAEPYAYLVYIYQFLGFAGIVPIEESKRVCHESANMAMQSDPENAWSQLAAGIEGFVEEKDWEQIQQSLEKSIELNPNLAPSRVWMAWLCHVTRQHERRDENLLKAYGLDPLGGETVPSIAEINLLSGNIEAAIRYGNEALKFNPENMYAGCITGIATGFNGDWKKSIEIISDVCTRAPYFLLAQVYLGYAHIRSGNLAQGKQILSMVERTQREQPDRSFHHLIAILYLALGDKEKFHENYRTSIKNKMVASLWIYGSPWMKDAMQDPRMETIRKELKLFK